MYTRSYLGGLKTEMVIWENPAQFENRFKPRVYVRRITGSTMYEKAVRHDFVCRKRRKENSSVAC